MIPLFCMEEHQEAFYDWGVAIEKGFIKPAGNVLFHVDHHDDLEGGGYFHDFTRPIQDLEERRQMTLDKLGIADFILPALYEGIFSRLYNMKGLRECAFSSREKVIQRIGKNALIMKDYIPFLHAAYRKEGRDGYQFFEYFEGSLSDTGDLEEVVLDIDLDYFCWDDSLSTVPPKRMEITRQAYEEYQNNPCHPFRILPRRLLRTEEVEGRCYLRYEEPAIEEKQAHEERIRKRIERFLKWLGERTWKPKVITLCRSRQSGYVPAFHADLVEELVRDGLEVLYELEEQGRTL